MENIYGEKYTFCQYGKGATKESFIRDRVNHPEEKEECDDGFVVFDIGDVIAKHKKWCELLPKVKPFYAVKCRPYTVILKLMDSLGINFDCASKAEMESILNIGVPASRIIYSHTRKQPSSLAYAKDNNIDLMTFDDESELRKIKQIYPNARLLLRFAVENPSASCFAPGIKFGCLKEDVRNLLELAKELHLNVVGVHFHVGTGNSNPKVYAQAIAFSRRIFNVASELGFEMKILDLGGSFPGDQLSSGLFEDYAENINAAIDTYFPTDCQVKVIAEPGTYYMKSAGTIVACVIGKRRRSTGEANDSQDSSDGPHFDYFVNDNLYTSLRDIIYMPDSFVPIPLKKKTTSTLYSGILYGNTCCGTDVIKENTLLPELSEGEWIYFEDKGDYSHMATNFNGFKRPFCYYAVPTNFSDWCNGETKSGTTWIPRDVFYMSGKETFRVV